MVPPRTQFRPILGVLFILVTFVFGEPWNTNQWVSAQTQSLFLRLSETDGTPVTDLRPDEVIILWDNIRCETLYLEPIERPVRVTIFVDNGPGSHSVLAHIREGIRLFVDQLPQEVLVGLATTSERVQFMTKHTTNRKELFNGIGLTVPQHGPSVFLDALIEEAEKIADEKELPYFPVFVMVTTIGPEASTRQRSRLFEKMMQRFHKANVTVHALMYAPASGLWVQPRGNQIRWGIDITEATGGTYDSVSSGNAFRRLLPQLSQEISRKHSLVSSQYRVTYVPPEGTSEHPVVRVMTTRDGLTLLPTIDGNIH